MKKDEQYHIKRYKKRVFADFVERYEAIWKELSVFHRDYVQTFVTSFLNLHPESLEEHVKGPFYSLIVEAEKLLKDMRAELNREAEIPRPPEPAPAPAPAPAPVVDDSDDAATEPVSDGIDDAGRDDAVPAPEPTVPRDDYFMSVIARGISEVEALLRRDGPQTSRQIREMFAQADFYPMLGAILWEAERQGRFEKVVDTTKRGKTRTTWVLGPMSSSKTSPQPAADWKLTEKELRALRTVITYEGEIAHKIHTRYDGCTLLMLTGLEAQGLLRHEGRIRHWFVRWENITPKLRAELKKLPWGHSTSNERRRRFNQAMKLHSSPASIQ